MRPLLREISDENRLPLLLATMLGFSAVSASAQVTPGEPARNQTIPEKDRSRPQDRPKGGTTTRRDRSGYFKTRSGTRAQFDTGHSPGGNSG
jgi:hypothetical protein